MSLRRSFLIILSLCLLQGNGIFAQEKPKVNWMTLDEAQEKFKEQHKPIFIDLYTDWCYWCKVMDNRTYQNEKVIAYLNENFYPVKMNAETKDSLMWDKKLHVYSPRYKVNTFAMFASRGQLRFPTTVFLIEKDNPIPVQGYLRTGDIEPILRYYGEGNYKQMSYKDYTRDYRNIW